MREMPHDRTSRPYRRVRGVTMPPRNRAAFVTIISVKPMIALSGVRSSWLMLVTNCDLCSLAADGSAARRSARD
jgi:hypothetical protein